MYSTIQCFAKYIPSVPPKGQQYAIFNNIANTDDKDIIVVWQDNEDRSYQCQNIEDAQVFIPFHFCSKCTHGSATVSNNIISGRECKHYSFWKESACNSRERISSTQSFMAASFSSFHDPCRTPNACSNHGICKHIPYTKNILCLCNEFYEGEKCEVFVRPAARIKLIEILFSIRNEFTQFVGLPTIIDIYLDIKEIPKQLESIRRHITDSSKFSNIINMFGEDFKNAEYILRNYNLLQSGSITEKILSERLSGLHMHRIQSGIESAILGRSVIINEDFMTVYKKSIVAEKGVNFACTRQYSELVIKLRNHLVLIDITLSETKVWKQTLTDNGYDQNIIIDAENELNASKNRTVMYRQFWSRTSCPELNSSDLKEHFCDDYHSYEGLQVQLSCDNVKHPSPESVTCSKNGSELKWSSSPVCLLSQWTKWSSCSRTCGGGIKTRSRTKPNGDVDTDQASCNNQDCCQEKLVMNIILLIYLYILLRVGHYPTFIIFNH